MSKAFLEYIEEKEIQMVDFRFSDLNGVWHHMSFPVSQVDESFLENGICFDGSSILGWNSIESSDMLMVPCIDDDLSNVYEDPFFSEPTAIVICNIFYKDGKPYKKDPRYISKMAEEYLKTTQIADTAFFGPEPEFFLFDSIRFGVESFRSFYEIEASELPHNNMKGFFEESFGHRSQKKGAYFPVPPIDLGQDIRTEIVQILSSIGIETEKHHHEVAPAQHEIGFKYSTLTRISDHIQLFKYVVKNTAHKYGKTATFMPKPLFDDNGSGMHIHHSLWKNDLSIFSGNGYAGLSEEALYYIGGIFKHAKSLNAFTNPTTNSYRRLIPGFEAPISLAYSSGNRSAACRIPFSNPKSTSSKRIETRFPDPTANSYLAISAMLMAGIDGIQNKIHPGEPREENLYKTKEHVPKVASSLEEALESLRNDHEYLLKGNVFSKELIDSFIDLKHKESNNINQSPHPAEFITCYYL